MRKLLFALFIALATMFTACENNDAKLVEGLKGSWKGESKVGGKTVSVEYQYFESTDGKTGKFVEITNLSYLDSLNGVEYAIPYLAYVGGEYSVEDGWFKIKYYPETTNIDFDQNAILDYAADFLQYQSEIGDTTWADETPESLKAFFIETLTDGCVNDWQESCEDFNNSIIDSFDNLYIDENTMSFKCGDLGKVEFQRKNHNFFDEYPY